MARYRNGSRGAETRVARRIETRAVEVPDGHGLCQCGRVLKLTLRGRLRAHRDPRGQDCANRAVVDPLRVSPELVAAALAAQDEKYATAVAEGRQKTYGGRGTTLSPTGRCQAPRDPDDHNSEQCGKPVTGERRYCGACLAARL